MGSYIAKPLSRKKIREFTLAIRKMIDLEDVLFFPIVHLLEFVLPGVDSDFNYVIKSSEEMPNEYAVCYPEENTIFIREDVYERAVAGNARDRFTIAHEIGHYLMHTPSRIELARKDNYKELPPYKCPEWQANTFAGELLAPPHIIKGLTKYEISEKCGVSLKVGEIQLDKL